MRILLLVLGLMRAALAEGLSEEQRSARAHEAFVEGMTHFNLEEYDLAIHSWQSGFRLRQAPEFLFNIAQAHRKSNRAEPALGFYKRYLELAPQTPNREVVERHIAALEKLADAERKSAAASPDQPMPAPKAEAPPAPIVEAPPPPPPRRPLHRRWWLWTSVGAVVVAGVAVGLGVGLTRPEPFSPTAADFGPGARP